MSNPKSNKVGYRCPPQEHQFQKGQSGNPKGRPKGSKNFTNILQEELDRKVSVTENGRSQRVSKARIAVVQQVNKAVQGDFKAFQAIAKVQQAADASLQPLEQVGAPISEVSEEQCMEMLRQWFHKQREAGS